MPKPRIVGSTPPTKTETNVVNQTETHREPSLYSQTPTAPGRKCPNCGIGVGDEAVICWQCKSSMTHGRRGDIDKRGWILVAILSFVLLVSFVLPYATYTETDSYYGETTVTTATLSGYELAEGALYMTILGMTVKLNIGAAYPVLWAVPAMAIACLLLALVKRIPARPRMLGIFGLAAVVTAITGYAQLITNDAPGILSSGTFVPGYGLGATVFAGAFLSLIGFRNYLASRKRALRDR